MDKNDTHVGLRNENVQELLDAIPNWMIRYGNTLVLCITILFFMLSWFIKYPDIITSNAYITTQLPPQKKYAQLNGKLDTILIKNNEYVQKGQFLTVIENTANFEHVKILKSVIDTIKINNKSFNFPIDKLPVLLLGDIDIDYAIFENNYIQYQLNKKLQPFDNEQNKNKVSRLQLYNRLHTLMSQKHINNLELEYQKKDLERQKQLFTKGVIAKQDLESKELAYLQAKRNYANMDASISQTNEAIHLTNTNSVSTSIKKTKEDIRLLKNTIQSFNKLKRAIKDWELKYTVITDIDGTVAFSKSWFKNQNINQGELLFSIIPKESSSYVAKLKTPSQNSGKIKEGQKVNIKIENYPEFEFGTLQGHVESISLLTNENGFYNINVSLPDQLITSYGKNIQFKYEMRGTAEIITEDLRLIERFFYQLRKVFDT
ncbi:HlyD family secretion protein [Psychroserpens algicola]|uniref:HlyD family secretion protein n=1 Tax=Psychroserpens algicola TaxID=1719034 RepID=A0ABT0H6U2_9FLAO|nr:HlyD family efflux transporter periplasmic adaptor subunit [Psychroserpens algicola]MCK8480088.1 HlyD family secretion protein [Psychroserpens algicola]